MNSFPAIEIDKVKAWDFRLIDENTAESLNVAYGVDSNYLDGVGVSITSIVINNRHVNLDFYIIADVYNDDFFQKVEKLAEQYQLRITLYIIFSACLVHKSGQEQCTSVYLLFNYWE